MWRCTGRITIFVVGPLKAQVRNGRLVMDEPTKLPEGTVLELTAVDPGDDLDEEERAALHQAIRRSWKQAKAGQTRPASKVYYVHEPKLQEVSAVRGKGPPLGKRRR
jgi:hypothetical protein